MAYDHSIFNISPYYDDFDPDNKFLKILFKPGYAVQARELSQLQSILQNQISKIGDHLFKDGSRVVGAPITVRNANFLGFNTGTGTPFSAFDSNDWDSLIGGTVYWGATANAVINNVLAPETDDKVFVVVDYINGYGNLIPTTGITVGVTAGDGSAYSPFVPSGSTYNGLCKLVTVGDGIFYVDGSFVVNNEQSFTPYSVENSQRNLSGTVGGVTFSNIDKKVGFAITRDTTTSSEDTTLLDPSFGSPNYNAPGADRYTINLTLDQAGIDETPDDFIELLRFQDGKVTKKVDRVIYGDISQTLSRRTYDESGSYIVSPFDISVREGESPENLDVVVGPGKAYLFGNEVETKYPTILGVSKGRETQTTSSSFAFNVGNVIGVCMDRTTNHGGATAYTYFNLMNGGSSLIRFRNSSGTQVGLARVHGFIPIGTTATVGYTIPSSTQGFGISGPSYFSLYMYGVCSGSMVSGSSYAHVYSHSGVTYATVFPNRGTTFAMIGGSADSDLSLVYAIAPTQGIDSFTNLSFYGKAVTKSSSAWTNSTAVWSGLTTATFTIDVTDLDFPSYQSNSIPTSYINLIWSSSIPTSPTTSSSTSVLNEYHIVNSNGLTSGLVVSPGDFVGASNASATITNSSNKVVLSVSGFPAGFTGSVRVVVPFKYTPSFSTASGVSASCRTKTPTSYTPASTQSHTLSLINGRLGFTLPHWDVYSVSAISRNGTSIMTDFELDDGQREAFYDSSAFVVKKSKEGSAISGGGNYTVSTTISGLSYSYNYYRHGGTDFGPFVGKHSYLGVSYENIPLFTNPRTGKTVSLANCVDFRHSGSTYDAIVSKPYGIYEGFNQTETTTGVSWSNYLPRIDRVSLKVNPSDFSTSFSVDTGVSELSPISPPETENSMTLATIVLPAYTHNTTDVVINKNDVRRFTMTDIQNVEKRIDNIESFAKLSISESEIDSKAIKPIVDSYFLNGGVTSSSSSVYVLTTEPVKTSIYTDDFYGHAGGDVSDTNHRCSVDYEHGEMRSMFLHNLFTLGSGTYTNTVVSSDGLVTLPYSAASFIENKGYNKAIKINPTGTVNWLGFINLSKQYEPLFDTSVRPLVYSNNLLENDNWIGSNANDTSGFGTQWNDWEFLWTGSSIRTDQKDDIQKRILETPRTKSSSSIPTVNSGNKKTSVSRALVSTDQKVGNMLSAGRFVGRTRYKTVDNKIVDRTVVPYIPSNNIGVTAYGLRPNSSGLNLYVDGILIKSGLTSNSNGTVGVTFAFSSETNISGEKSIRISDNAVAQNATQAADKIFYCTGTINQRFDGVYSTRNPEYRRQTVTSEGIIKDPFNREISYDNIEETLNNNQWVDPLCQTFFVDKKQYPEGIFAKNITLYFAEKDTTLPVTVQLRPTINGYPSPSVSLPFSTVTLLPSSVNTGFVNTTEPNGTTFTFSSPVYLEPGEYAISVITNSKDYELRANDSGINLTNDGRNNNPIVGTLYQPQSIGPAAQNLSTDISFSIEMCEFTQSSGYAEYTNTDVANCQVIKVNVPSIVPIGSSTAIRLNPGASQITLLNGQNKYMSSVYTSSQTLKLELSKPTNTYISPAIDIGMFFGVGAEMIITSETSPNTRTITPTSSYVSKAVSLPEDLVSNGIFVTAEVCCPYGSEVRAYVRWSDRGESDLFGKSWSQMTSVSGIGSPKYPFSASSDLSTSDYDYRPTQWLWFGSQNNPTIRSYQICILYTTTLTGSSKVYEKLPSTRNLRMSSFRSI